MIYLTMSPRESLEEFKRRVRFEAKGKRFLLQGTSRSFGKGVQVLSLVSSTLNEQMKLEVPEWYTAQVAADYDTTLAIKRKSPPRRMDGLGNIEDL